MTTATTGYNYKAL